ncbi:MAG: hypothetical protein F4Z92_14560, partial [Gemmatimonadetes bacterium]|nr:hypothetical protein [Gemmatimonadota bacterium]
MRLETYTGAPDQVETPLLVVLVPDGGPFAELAPLSRATGDTLSQAVSLGDFQGRESDRFIGYRSGSRGPQRVLFAGVGSLEAMSRSR